MSIRVERSEVGPGVPGANGGPSAAFVRAVGALLVIGPISWGVGVAVDLDGYDDEKIYVADMISGVPYLLGLGALCALVLACRATGDRKGRAFPIIPMALFPLAMAVNLGSIPYETYEDLPTWVNVLDPAWPLSQIGMLASAIAIIRVGRWQGAVRWLPLAGSLWLVAGMVGKIALEGAAGTLVFVLWLIATYSTLGVLLLVRPGAVDSRM
ncbi:hypothetical protein [Actinocorallia longicatena]|uniref:DUF998 domain-containing protein n=1 Tax=Actinocorallia longicatena TaxID=111803 RepID=A0ABP6QJK1_9ACTN